MKNFIVRAVDRALAHEGVVGGSFGAFLSGGRTGLEQFADLVDGRPGRRSLVGQRQEEALDEPSEAVRVVARDATDGDVVLLVEEQIPSCKDFDLGGGG